MNRIIGLLVALLLCDVAIAQEKKLVRPRINGIGRVTIYVRNHAAAMDFYSKKLDYYSSSQIPCERPPHFCFGNWLQILDVVSPSSPEEGHFLGEIDFRTPHLEAMHRYLQSQNVKVSEIMKIERNAAHYELDYFNTTDPDGHLIGFVNVVSGCVICDRGDPTVGSDWEILHAGFVVRDRAAEEHFYKDILGFRPYWHGGMKDGQDDWVSLQVPNGTDWIEFMVNVSPDADHHTLGVMNHIALGTFDIHATQKLLIANGWKPTEEPQMGRDGKWQLNLYDPDDTRIEFMEYKPVRKPCCSEFTGPHPDHN